ncbi:ABC transporter substrate-binding protein [Psychromonas sp. MB-3u-54]|uniref:ABC transporter substrate-binding protein n=1 Tax=Psychromonas sp. MB-3u-54 TaxID=2058319 RepID=UPI001E2C09D8|nr:ABC transporter substrate binding protein [Psychromonas sp. MB-3u-54]
MKKIQRISIWLVLCCTVLTAIANAGDFSSRPQSQPDQRWRIAYYQGGDYKSYYDYLYATAKGLSQLGWIEPFYLPDFPEKDSKKLWQWLSHNINSQYLEFVADGYYSAGWNDIARKKTRKSLTGRLNKSNDIDMVFAMGTWAGQDLANNLHRAPTIVISTSDPLHSGIIKSQNDPGYDHIFASYDPHLLSQQIQVFHQLIEFKKLGVFYENTVSGRSYAGMDFIEQASAELDYEIVPCYTQSDIADQQRVDQSVIECFDKLAEKVDALFVSTQGGVNAETIPKLVKTANRFDIPTFAQNGELQVRYGLLMSLIPRSGAGPEGMFVAENVGQIINGAKPRNLKQHFEGAFSMIMNMKTAEKIGLYVNADLLAAADKLYWQIELPQ